MHFGGDGRNTLLPGDDFTPETLHKFTTPISSQPLFLQIKKGFFFSSRLKEPSLVPPGYSQNPRITQNNPDDKHQGGKQQSNSAVLSLSVFTQLNGFSS